MSAAPPPDHAMATLKAVLPFKNRSAFVVSLSEGKNPRFVAVNHSEIPCQIEALTQRGKPLPIAFTLLRPLSPGFSSAPFKMGKGPAPMKADPDAKKLSELVAVTDDKGRTVSAMRLYAFKKAGGMADKGPRDEEHTSTLSAGATITMWLDPQRLEEKGQPSKSRYSETIVPVGVTAIPAFSVCEVTVASRNLDRALEGKGVKIVSVKLAPFSLYSSIPDLCLLEPTLGAARLAQTKNREAQKTLEQDLDTKNVMFFSAVSPKAQMDDSLAEVTNTVKLVDWGDPSTPVIDLPVETLLAYTNCTQRDWAMALLDLAIAVGALQVAVVANDQWAKGQESGLRGVPLVDVERLLHSLSPAELCTHDIQTNALVFDSGYHIDVDGAPHQLQIEFGLEPQQVQTGSAPLCPDMPLTGPHSELQAAHFLAFHLVGPSPLQGVWRGYLNVSPHGLLATSAAAGIKRKRFQPMIVAS